MNNKFEEEGRRRAEMVRKALNEGRMTSFRWHEDGSGCEFQYKGIDNHGLPCAFLSNLNAANSLYVFTGIRITFTHEEGGAK